MATKKPVEKAPPRSQRKVTSTREKITEDAENPTPQLSAVQVWQAKLAARDAQRAVERLKKKPAGAAGHGKKTIATMTKICDRIADGESLHGICEDYEMPTRHTVFGWITSDTEYEALYNKALQLRGEKFAEDTTALSNEALHAPPELTPAYRLAVDTRKWAAARLLPRKYGDRVVVAGDSENPLTIKHISDASELLAKMRSTK